MHTKPATKIAACVHTYERSQFGISQPRESTTRNSFFGRSCLSYSYIYFTPALISGIVYKFQSEIFGSGIILFTFASCHGEIFPRFQSNFGHEAGRDLNSKILYLFWLSRQYLVCQERVGSVNRKFVVLAEEAAAAAAIIEVSSQNEFKELAAWKKGRNRRFLATSFWAWSQVTEKSLCLPCKFEETSPISLFIITFIIVIMPLC